MESVNEIFSSVEETPQVDEFQVDDLLDLGALPEPEKEKEENEDIAKGVVFLAFEKKESLNLLGISIPEEADAADLEWLSRFVDDCHSEQQPAVAPCFPTRKNEVFIPVKAKRSKRLHRISKFWSTSNTSPVSSISSQSPSSSCSSSSYLSQESYHKKRGRKPKSSSAGGLSGERLCTHCGVQKTPQWRAGPHGPKTLCNACGVRFKSGRLLPEYRPACSPTFMSNIHSNKHQAVLELRRKKESPLFCAVSAPLQRC